MRKKIIYVDFTKKRRVNFLSFIIYRVVSFLSNKFEIHSKSEYHHYTNKKRISN